MVDQSPEGLIKVPKINMDRNSYPILNQFLELINHKEIISSNSDVILNVLIRNKKHNFSMIYKNLKIKNDFKFLETLKYNLDQTKKIDINSLQIICDIKCEFLKNNNLHKFLPVELFNSDSIKHTQIDSFLKNKQNRIIIKKIFTEKKFVKFTSFKINLLGLKTNASSFEEKDIEKISKIFVKKTKCNKDLETSLKNFKKTNSINLGKDLKNSENITNKIIYKSLLKNFKILNDKQKDNKKILENYNEKLNMMKDQNSKLDIEKILSVQRKSKITIEKLENKFENDLYKIYREFTSNINLNVKEVNLLNPKEFERKNLFKLSKINKNLKNLNDLDKISIIGHHDLEENLISIIKKNGELNKFSDLIISDVNKIVNFYNNNNTSIINKDKENILKLKKSLKLKNYNVSKYFDTKLTLDNILKSQILISNNRIRNEDFNNVEILHLDDNNIINIKKQIDSIKYQINNCNIETNEIIKNLLKINSTKQIFKLLKEKNIYFINKLQNFLNNKNFNNSNSLNTDEIKKSLERLKLEEKEIKGIFVINNPKNEAVKNFDWITKFKEIKDSSNLNRKNILNLKLSIFSEKIKSKYNQFLENVKKFDFKKINKSEINTENINKCTEKVEFKNHPNLFTNLIINQININKSISSSSLFTNENKGNIISKLKFSENMKLKNNKSLENIKKINIERINNSQINLENMNSITEIVESRIFPCKLTNLFENQLKINNSITPPSLISIEHLKFDKEKNRNKNIEKFVFEKLNNSEINFLNINKFTEIIDLQIKPSKLTNLIENQIKVNNSISSIDLISKKAFKYEFNQKNFVKKPYLEINKLLTRNIIDKKEISRALENYLNDENLISNSIIQKVSLKKSIRDNQHLVDCLHSIMINDFKTIPLIRKSIYLPKFSEYGKEKITSIQHQLNSFQLSLKDRSYLNLKQTIDKDRFTLNGTGISIDLRIKEIFNNNSISRNSMKYPIYNLHCKRNIFNFDKNKINNLLKCEQINNFFKICESDFKGSFNKSEFTDIHLFTHFNNKEIVLVKELNKSINDCFLNNESNTLIKNYKEQFCKLFEEIKINNISLKEKILRINLSDIPNSERNRFENEFFKNISIMTIGKDNKNNLWNIQFKLKLEEFNTKNVNYDETIKSMLRINRYEKDQFFSLFKLGIISIFHKNKFIIC